MAAMTIPRGLEQEYAVTGAGDSSRCPPRRAVQLALDALARSDLVHAADWAVADETGNLGYEESLLAVWDPALARRPVLANGMRVYDDTGHFEVSSPVVAHPADALRYDRVADALAWAATTRAGASTGVALYAYKNNVSTRRTGDGYESVAYGTHHNLSLHRRRLGADWDRQLSGALGAWFACRPLLVGGGDLLPVTRPDGTSVLWTNGRLWGTSLHFSLSPRSAFVRLLASADTTVDRGLVNLRDEPHAEAGEYLRYHDINLDALRCPYQFLLRDALQVAVFGALEEGRLRDAPRLEHPPQALKDVCFSAGEPDVTVTLADGRRAHVLRDLLGDYYLDRALGWAEALGEQLTVRLLREASWVVERLRAGDLESLRWLLDWCTKLRMIEGASLRDEDALALCNQYALLEASNVEAVAVRDLAGGNLHDGGDSFFDAGGAWQAAERRLGAEMCADLGGPVTAALRTGPSGTRDHLRTELMQRLAPHLVAVSWSRLHFDSGEILSLADPAGPDPEDPAGWLEGIADLDDLRRSPLGRLLGPSAELEAPSGQPVASPSHHQGGAHD